MSHKGSTDHKICVCSKNKERNKKKSNKTTTTIKEMHVLIPQCSSPTFEKKKKN